MGPDTKVRVHVMPSNNSSLVIFLDLVTAFRDLPVLYFAPPRRCFTFLTRTVSRFNSARVCAPVLSR